MTSFLLRREIDDCMLRQVNGQRLPDQSVVDGINSNNNQNDKGKMFYLEKEKPKIKQETKKTRKPCMYLAGNGRANLHRQHYTEYPVPRRWARQRQKTSRAIY